MEWLTWLGLLIKWWYLSAIINLKHHGTFVSISLFVATQQLLGAANCYEIFHVFVRLFTQWLALSLRWQERKWAFFLQWLGACHRPDLLSGVLSLSAILNNSTAMIMLHTWASRHLHISHAQIIIANCQTAWRMHMLSRGCLEQLSQFSDSWWGCLVYLHYLKIKLIGIKME